MYATAIPRDWDDGEYEDVNVSACIENKMTEGVSEGEKRIHQVVVQKV